MEHSESIKELATALSKAQGEIQGVKKEAENKELSTSYSDLNSVWETIRDPFAKYGLAVIQAPDSTGIETLIAHESGQWIKSRINYPTDKIKSDKKINALQQLGSIITYLRRYSLSAMSGVAAKDDDGQGFNQPESIEETIPLPKKENKKEN